jgi:5-methyltetrahydrofolate--homocysteine methyltransferase
MGTSLTRSGAARPGAPVEVLNEKRPEAVKAAHRAFLEAGSDIIQTNTFQGNATSLGREGLAERAVELNRAGAALAREVAGNRAYVAGSIGPTGGVLEPYGELAEDAARVAFEEQAQALFEAGVDFFIVETFSAVEEAVIAVRAAAATGLPVAASLAFEPSGRTSFGVTPQRGAEELAAAGAEVVGANCGTISPSEMVEIARQFREATDLPLIAQPNAGRPQQTATGVVYPEAPEGMAEAAGELVALGATIVGGCCGSTAEHIRAIAARVHR